jgi:hypothetical protein
VSPEPDELIVPRHVDDGSAPDADVAPVEIGRELVPEVEPTEPERELEPEPALEPQAVVAEPPLAPEPKHEPEPEAESEAEPEAGREVVVAEPRLPPERAVGQRPEPIVVHEPAPHPVPVAIVVKEAARAAPAPVRASLTGPRVPATYTVLPPVRRRRSWLRRTLVLLLGIAAAAAGVLAFTSVTADTSASDPSASSPRRAGAPPARNEDGTGQGASAGQGNARKGNGQAAPAPSASKPTKPKNRTEPTPKSRPKQSGGSKKTAPPPSKPAARAEPRRFAWAPVEGALRYHIELFRGADRILAVDTTQPVLELGTTWRHQGKVVRLTPGAYRWYVWPVTKSGRAVQAVVQAKLEIP